jgi:hypothetical protein
MTGSGDGVQDRHAEDPGIGAEAEAALAAAFDSRAFHDTVLGGGALPLSILEQAG